MIEPEHFAADYMLISGRYIRLFYKLVIKNAPIVAGNKWQQLKGCLSRRVATQRHSILRRSSMCQKCSQGTGLS